MNQLAELTYEEAIKRAKSLVPSIRSRVYLSEELRHQPKETIEEIIQSGLVRSLVPKRWGGHELSWKTLADTATEVAKANASAGWCYSLLLLQSWMIAFFPNQAQKDVWKKNPDACMASSLNPSPDTMVERVEGGYRLSGKWGFLSGINHCDWITISAKSPEGIDLYYLVPKSDINVIDVWHVIGMRGTGSNLIELKDVFIPEYRTMEINPWNHSGISPGMKENTSSMYRIQLSAVMPVTIFSVILGATKGAYETWRDLVIAKKPTKGGVAIGNLTHQQIRLAQVATKIQSADALLHQSLEVVESGRVLNYQERVRLRCQYSYGAQICSEAMETIFTTSGAAASSEKHPLQQYWRDIHAGAQHASFNFDTVGELFGKMELGLPVEMYF